MKSKEFFQQSILMLCDNLLLEWRSCVQFSIGVILGYRVESIISNIQLKYLDIWLVFNFMDVLSCIFCYCRFHLFHYYHILEVLNLVFCCWLFRLFHHRLFLEFLFSVYLEFIFCFIIYLFDPYLIFTSSVFFRFILLVLSLSVSNNGENVQHSPRIWHNFHCH